MALCIHCNEKQCKLPSVVKKTYIYPNVLMFWGVMSWCVNTCPVDSCDMLSSGLREGSS